VTSQNRSRTNLSALAEWHCLMNQMQVHSTAWINWWAFFRLQICIFIQSSFYAVK